MDQIKCINQKCEGWAELAELRMLDLTTAYFNQVIGKPQKQLTEKPPKNALQSTYMYSAYLKHYSKK